MVNFFLGQAAGVIPPYLSAMLREHHWSYGRVGVVIAMSGLGMLLMQTPAGLLIDRISARRLLLGSMALCLGCCYGLIPLAAHSGLLVGLAIFVSGAAMAFFAPLLGSLAVALVGRKNLAPTMGVNQSFSHAGNIAAAVVAIPLVRTLGSAAVFYITLAVSVLAILSLFFIRKDELNEDLTQDSASGGSPSLSPVKPHPLHELPALLRDARVQTVLICVLLFHFANSPVESLVTLYLKSLGTSDEKIALIVLISQSVMVPVAWLAGKYCTKFGRKPVFAAAFLVLPVRIMLYSMTRNPSLVFAIHCLDGMSTGIYGVVVALICSDLTRGKTGFNTLLGMASTAQALGAVLGPLLEGSLTQYFGFRIAFLAFAAIAAIGGVIFFRWMPETAA